MKLYVIDKRSNAKTYLNIVAHDRKALAKAAGSEAIVVNGSVYRLSEVKAEPEVGAPAVGGLIGGILGALAGGGGVLVGGLIGAAIGQSQLAKEERESAIFNGSTA